MKRVGGRRRGTLQERRKTRLGVGERVARFIGVLDSVFRKSKIIGQVRGEVEGENATRYGIRGSANSILKFSSNREQVFS